MSHELGYARFDQVKPIDDGIWIVDAEPIRAGGLPLPLRMTVLRLANGDLLLYSPTRHTLGLQREIEALGTIRHLVAPNISHWMFVRDWQQACPGAKTWGAPGLRKRAQVQAAGVRVDADLGPVAPDDWRAEVDQVLVTSGPFAEIDLFHRSSRTLLVTDLVLNVEGEGMPPLARTFAGLAGILAPNGKAPIYLRLLLKWNASRVSAAAAHLVSLAPERVIMAHGRPFTEAVPDRLRASLEDLLGAGWRTPRGNRSTTRGGVGVASIVGAGLLIGMGVLVARKRARKERRL